MQVLKSMVVMLLGFLALCVLLLGSGRLMVLLLGVEPAVAEAATFQCGAGDASCLLAAITQANGQQNTITLAAGTYSLTTVDNTTDGANGLPSITSALVIRGAGAEQTIVERNVNAPEFRLLHVAATGALTLRGLTLRGGASLSYSNRSLGGAVFNQGGTITLSQTTIAENMAHYGAGGLVINGGTATIADSTLADNWSDNTDSGGLANYGGQVRIARSLVIGNSAFHEVGGLYTEGGTMTIMRTTIAGNFADGAGGLWIESGTVTITDSAIVDNDGRYWTHGIWIWSGNLTITNSTIARNKDLAAYDNAGGAGGLESDGGTTRILNSTIAENSLIGTTTGGGIKVWGGTVEVQNTILARNTAEDHGYGYVPDCYGPITSLGNNLIGDPTGCTITVQPTDRTGDPGLGAYTDDGTPGTGHFPLLSTSQAINAGNDTACPRRDQLGARRGHPCDLGAVEFQDGVEVAAVQ
jgi:hypothetical protein